MHDCWPKIALVVKFLIAVVKERVFEKYGIRLEEEIQLV
jgi:UDP-N-acetylenolpyruvoylglucosamine reductase